MKKQKLLIFSGLFFPVTAIIVSFSFLAQPGNNILKTLLFKLETYYNWYPQQKVYLHTDKSSYDSNETLWLKAYVLNATTHKPDSSSTNLYVELISPGGKLYQEKMLKIEKGFANGDFSFQDTIPDGVYRLRAFTNRMLNFEEGYIFSKDVYISNPDFKIYANRYKVRTVKKEIKENNRKSEKFDVSFYPEGGHLLSGVENKIGFKAINQMGAGVNISGELLDKKGNKVADYESSHLGIGSFVFIPQPGMKYNAFVKTPDGKVNKFPFPEAIDQGVTLYCAFQQDGQLKVGLNYVFKDNKYPANTTYYLIVHSRGYPVYTASIDLVDENRTVLIPQSSLPSGVLHITLFNVYSNPVSERLVFVNNKDGLKIDILPEKTVANPREKIGLKIHVTDKQDKPVKGNFSLSIAEDNNVLNSENILINLLLNSDIRAKIEDPGYYFNDYNAKKENELDNLLLTQGWRRFKWQTVLLNEKRPLLFPEENKITITGKITKEFFGIPLRDIPVTLSFLNEYNDVFKTRTLYDGRFKFEGLEYSDTLSVKIEAERRSGRKNLVILLDYKETQVLKDMNYITNQYLKKPGVEGKYKVPEEVVSDDPFYEKNTKIDRIHGEPRDVIIVDNRFQGYSSVAQVLQGRIPGVSVNGYKVIIRGVSTFYGNTDPLFLIDNIQVDAYSALSLPPNEVERIEVLKGPDAAVYGSRGGNGVIAIFTKRGKYMLKGVINFKMLGYSTPKEYYSPKYPYITEDPFLDERKTILWVPNLITNNEGTAETSFFTSDIKGSYAISVEGINFKGVPGAGNLTFSIK